MYSITDKKEVIMKLLRYGLMGSEKPGILDQQGNIRDLSTHIHDINAETIATLKQTILTININELPVVDNTVRIGSCISLPGKIMCIGYNSRLHTQQMGVKPSNEADMVVFLKPSSAISGPNDPILYGRHVTKLDWEAELGVVIGKKGKYIEKDQADDYIFGFTCINDVSERYWQFETDDKQYTKGKGMDGFAPIGPYLVSKDDIADASNLNIKLWVNDELRQDFNTSDYIHNAGAVVSYLSQFFTLFPGDVIAMGSAPGNAKFWGEDKFLKVGDTMTFEVEGLGKQQQKIVKE